MNNIKIRREIEKRGVRYWQVADALGIHEVTFCKRLRHELPEVEQERILKVIDDMEVTSHE